MFDTVVSYKEAFLIFTTTAYEVNPVVKIAINPWAMLQVGIETPLIDASHSQIVSSSDKNCATPSNFATI